MLADALASVNDFAGAADALTRAQALKPGDPTLEADLAHALAMNCDWEALETVMKGREFPPSVFFFFPHPRARPNTRCWPLSLPLPLC